MYATNLHSLIFICSISTLLRSALAQMALPPIACPQYFQYVSDDFDYYGLITLPITLRFGRVFGRHNLESYSEDGIVTRDANKLIIHTDYVDGQPNADLALLQIEPLEQFSEYIKPICLWSELDESSLNVGKTASVFGWGYEGEREKDISPLPKMVDVKTVSKNDCLSSSEAFQTLVTDKTICVGNRDGTGPCIGDSGSALMLQRNGRWVLRGVASVGQSSRQLCDLFEYVVYCDAAKYM